MTCQPPLAITTNKRGPLQENMISLIRESSVRNACTPFLADKPLHKKYEGPFNGLIFNGNLVDEIMTMESTSTEAEPGHYVVIRSIVVLLRVEVKDSLSSVYT